MAPILSRRAPPSLARRPSLKRGGRVLGSESLGVTVVEFQLAGHSDRACWGFRDGGQRAHTGQRAAMHIKNSHGWPGQPDFCSRKACSRFLNWFLSVFPLEAFLSPCRLLSYSWSFALGSCHAGPHRKPGNKTLRQNYQLISLTAYSQDSQVASWHHATHN